MTTPEATYLSVRQAAFITAAHFRVRAETGASAAVLTIAFASAGIVLVTFVFTTLIHESASVITRLAILGLSVALAFGWKRTGAGRASALTASAARPPSGRRRRTAHDLGEQR